MKDVKNLHIENSVERNLKYLVWKSLSHIQLFETPQTV